MHDNKARPQLPPINHPNNLLNAHSILIPYEVKTENLKTIDQELHVQADSSVREREREKGNVYHSFIQFHELITFGRTYIRKARANRIIACAWLLLSYNQCQCIAFNMFSAIFFSSSGPIYHCFYRIFVFVSCTLWSYLLWKSRYVSVYCAVRNVLNADIAEQFDTYFSNISSYSPSNKFRKLPNQLRIVLVFLLNLFWSPLPLSLETKRFGLIPFNETIWNKQKEKHGVQRKMLNKVFGNKTG